MPALNIAEAIGPAEDIYLVTPSDTVDLFQKARCLICDVDMLGGVTITTGMGRKIKIPCFKGWNPVSCIKIWETDTDTNNGSIWAVPSVWATQLP